MENNSNRRILLAIGFVLFFVIIILIWYFFYAKPVIKKDITRTNDPVPVRLFPAGFQFLNWGNEPTSTSTTEITDPLTLPLVRVWDKPATGQTFVTQNILREIVSTSTQGTTTIETRRTVRATSTVIVFVDRMTGYIYGFPLETGKPFQMSNTVMPGVYDAQIFDEGKKVILRYLDQEKNKIVGVVANIPNVQENEMPLPLTNIQYITNPVTSIATNFKKDKVSYLVTTETGSSLYTITAKGPTLVTSSPFKEWMLSYGGENLYVTSKPSAYVNGATFSIPTFQPEVTEKTGLMSTPGANGVILNSMWSAQGLATFISDNGDIKLLASKTLASKCAWGERKFLVCAIPKLTLKGSEGLPDDWFQGRVSYSDDFFAVDSTTGETYPLYSFKQDEGNFDVTNMTISKENIFLTFNKKQDSTLWLLNTSLIEGDPRE